MTSSSFRNLYRFEMRQNWRSALIWTVLLAAVMVLFMSLFPSMSKTDFMDIVVAKVDALPKELVSAFGLGSYLDLRNATYFFAYCWQFFSIALCVYAISLGSNIISKEHDEKHIDYLATKPIRERDIVTAKMAAVATLVALVTACLFAVAVALVARYDTTRQWQLVEIARLFGKSLAIYLFFGGLAASASLLLKKTSRSNMIVLSLFFVSYLLGAMSKIIPSVENLKYLSPFYMYETTSAAYGFSFTDWWYLAGLAAVTLLLYLVGRTRYERKDLSW